MSDIHILSQQGFRIRKRNPVNLVTENVADIA